MKCPKCQFEQMVLLCDSSRAIVLDTFQDLRECVALCRAIEEGLGRYQGDMPSAP